MTDARAADVGAASRPREMERLVAVMHRLRSECPWDAEQTHRSLVTYLIEETCETVEAIEDGSDVDLREELGDLLLQVIFHAEIATERAAFTLDQIAGDVADKLIERHPYVFAGESMPGDVWSAWEERKALAKGRTSALQGIPERMSSLARATKIINRAVKRGVAIDRDERPLDPAGLRAGLRSLLDRAQASGLDADQAMRDVARDLERAVAAAESV